MPRAPWPRAHVHERQLRGHSAGEYTRTLLLSWFECTIVVSVSTTHKCTWLPTWVFGFTSIRCLVRSRSAYRCLSTHPCNSVTRRSSHCHCRTISYDSRITTFNRGLPSCRFPRGLYSLTHLSTLSGWIHGCMLPPSLCNECNILLHPLHITSHSHFDPPWLT